MCLGVLPAYLSVYHVYAWYLGRSEEDNRSSGRRITGDHELPFRQSWAKSFKTGTLDVGRSLGCIVPCLPWAGSKPQTQSRNL